MVIMLLYTIFETSSLWIVQFKVEWLYILFSTNRSLGSLLLQIHVGSHLNRRGERGLRNPKLIAGSHQVSRRGNPIEIMLPSSSQQKI